MNTEEYSKEARRIKQGKKYSKTVLTMKEIGITNVSSNCQINNGTIVWRLPFKDAWGHNIEFATYRSGYVRKLITYHTRSAKCYQINQRVDGEETYYKVGDNLYRKFTSKACKLIPLHGDRIEYLLEFILRNYFVAKPKYNHVITMEMLDRVAKYSRMVEGGFNACNERTQNEILKSLQQ